MSYDIETPVFFLRKSAKFLRKHPELRTRFSGVIDALRVDPDQPSLHLHPLPGISRDFMRRV
jgi:hypothetical protein